MMTCDEALVLLSGHIDHENSALEEEHLRAHLERCPACRAALADYETIDRAIASLAVEPPEALARGVAVAVERPVRRRRSIFGAGTLAAAAAVAVVLLSTGRPGAPETVPTVEEEIVVSSVDDARRLRGMDAQFEAGGAEPAPALTIVDDPSAPAGRTIEALAGLDAKAGDGWTDYETDAATVREILEACGGYAVTVSEELPVLADSTPCVVRVLPPDGGGT